MTPSCDQTGVPIHFHSSTTSGSASLMSLRILPRVSPRQSPSSAILFEMSVDADWPWLAPDCFMFSSYKFQTHFSTLEFSSRRRAMELARTYTAESRRLEWGAVRRRAHRAPGLQASEGYFTSPVAVIVSLLMSQPCPTAT